MKETRILAAMEATGRNRTTKRRVGRPPIRGFGEAGFAEKYGTSRRFIRRFGVLRFAKLKTTRRELLASEHRLLKSHCVRAKAARQSLEPWKKCVVPIRSVPRPQSIAAGVFALSAGSGTARRARSGLEGHPIPAKIFGTSPQNISTAPQFTSRV